MIKASWSREPNEADQTLEENWLFRLRRERFRSRRSGLAHDFFVIQLADAVHVVALTADRELILVRQFRAGSGEESLELPGGLVDGKEDPRAAGARELREETGYTGDPPIVLCGVWANPSLLTSRITTVVIANARRTVDPKLDPGEEVAVELVPANAVGSMIVAGEITHALAVQGLLWWLLGEQVGGPFSTVAIHPTPISN